MFYNAVVRGKFILGTMFYEMHVSLTKWKKHITL